MPPLHFIFHMNASGFYYQSYSSLIFKYDFFRVNGALPMLQVDELKQNTDFIFHNGLHVGNNLGETHTQKYVYL